MKSIFKSMQGKASAAIQLAVVAVVVGVLALTMFAPHGLKEAMASTQNYPPGVGVYAIPIHLSGSYTSALSSVAAIKIPYAARLIGFTGIARSFSGVGAAPTVNLRAGASSVLSSALGLSTVAVTEGTIATSAIADETTLFVDYYLGVSGIEATDMTLLMTFLRR